MQARRNLLRFSLGVDKNCRRDAPALKSATHSPQALASLFLHAVDCIENHCLVVVVQLVENALRLCLQKLQVWGQWAVEAILRIKFKPQITQNLITLR